MLKLWLDEAGVGRRAMEVTSFAEAEQADWKRVFPPAAWECEEIWHI